MSLEKAKEYLGKICSSGNLLMTIINQILEIARIESGTTALQLKAEDINTLFHTVNTVFEEDVRKKNLQYSVDLDVYHTFILCDRSRPSAFRGRRSVRVWEFMRNCVCEYWGLDHTNEIWCFPEKSAILLVKNKKGKKCFT